MQNILRKLTSRKLWLALAGVAIGVAVVFGVDAGAVTTVAGAVTAMISVATYVIAEGRIDAAAIGQAAGQVQQAVGTLGEVMVDSDADIA